MAVHIGRSPRIHPIAKPTGPHQKTNIDNKVPRLGQPESNSPSPLKIPNQVSTKAKYAPFYS